MLNFNTVIVNETTSTNDDLELVLNSGFITENTIDKFHGYTEIAFFQSNGHGRFDRIWDSQIGGLYQSTLLFSRYLPKISFHTLSIISPLSVVAALSEFEPTLCFNIKWPNDIILDSRKISGILLKMIQTKLNNEIAFIIGIGVNVFNKINYSSLRNSAIILPISLKELTNKEYNKNDLITLSNLILKHFKQFLGDATCDFQGILSKYNNLLLYKNELIELFDNFENNNKLAYGYFQGIDNNGFIIIKDYKTNQINTYPSGEIKKI